MRGGSPIQEQSQNVETLRSESLGSIAQHSGSYLKYRSDPAPIVKELARAFCGKAWDGKAWVSVGEGSALANDSFMDLVIPIIQAHVNHNTPRGNITELEAHKITKDIVEDLVIEIGLNNMRYGIAKGSRDVITTTFDNMIFLTLSRAINDGERNHEDNIFKAGEMTRGSGSVGTSFPSKGLGKLFG